MCWWEKFQKFWSFYQRQGLKKHWLVNFTRLLSFGVTVYKRIRQWNIFLSFLQKYICKLRWFSWIIWKFYVIAVSDRLNYNLCRSWFLSEGNMWIHECFSKKVVEMFSFYRLENICLFFKCWILPYSLNTNIYGNLSPWSSNQIVRRSNQQVHSSFLDSMFMAAHTRHRTLCAYAFVSQFSRHVRK